MTIYKGKRNKSDILSGVKHTVRKSRFLANNTVEYFIEEDINKRIIRLHDTDILVFELEKDRGHEHDLVYIYTDGWKTPTTKDRLNNFGKGFFIWQENRRWYISDKMGNKSLFYEGACIQNGCLTRIEEKDSRTDKLEKLINKYCAKIGKLDKIPMPDQGDCWYCLGEAKLSDNLNQAEYGVLHSDGSYESKDWEATEDSCLLSHLEEGYIHGSLIFNALKYSGRNPILFLQMGLTGDIRRAVRKYFRGKLGLVR